MLPWRARATHTKILLGLFLGIAVGLIANLLKARVFNLVGTDGVDRACLDFVVDLNGFVGDLFLRGLRFIAVPIVLFTLIVGASSLRDVKKLSRIGGKTIGIYLGTTAFAIGLGLVFAQIVQPGRLVDPAVRAELSRDTAAQVASEIAQIATPSAWETLLQIVPTNPFAALVGTDGSGPVGHVNMLQVVLLGLVVGMTLAFIPAERARWISELAEAATAVLVQIVHFIMKLAPIAVFSLLARVVSELGLGVLGGLLSYGGVVVAGLGVMTFGVYPLCVRVFAGIRPARFLRAMAPAQLLAFSTSSSSATLPVTLDCVQQGLGVPEEVAGFAVPLGSTINMDGTALYQGVSAVFIAQLYGIDLSFADQLTTVVTATLASIGTAGVPGLGIVMLVIVLQSVGIPPEIVAGGIAVILGIERPLDMCRTACNVTGDAMVATVVASRE